MRATMGRTLFSCPSRLRPEPRRPIPPFRLPRPATSFSSFSSIPGLTEKLVLSLRSPKPCPQRLQFSRRVGCPYPHPQTSTRQKGQDAAGQHERRMIITQRGSRLVGGGCCTGCTGCWGPGRGEWAGPLIDNQREARAWRRRFRMSYDGG